ncbi:MAG: FAD-dependent oxidoreductase [Oscillospiraceae bacterium]|nr:FAD-dependent oxidoreductase [Oscillospiraceae bacterium]
MNYVRESERNIPVAAETDVLVAGGGIAGIAAALAAARAGKRTLLVEREFALGGMATLGLITIYLPLCDGFGHQVVFGIGEELLRLSISFGAEAEYPSSWLDGGSFEERCRQRFRVRFNPNLFALCAEKLLRESGVEILYGTVVCGAQREGRRLESVFIENKSGRSAIRARTFVDCSGDADLCALAGAKTTLHPGGNALADWYYSLDGGRYDLHMFGLADVIPEQRESYAGAAKTDAIGGFRFSGVDGAELSEAVQRAHEKLLGDVLKRRETSPDYVPVSMSSVPLVRMSRRLCGRSTMAAGDETRTMPDSIGMTGDWTRKGPIFEIPFSSLVGDDVCNLIVAGRIISADEPVWNVTRVIPPCAVTGQAAGTAAALFDSFDEADVPLLQKKLREAGVRLHREEVL